MHDHSPLPSPSPLPSTSHAFTFGTSQLLSYTSSVTLTHPHITCQGTNNGGPKSIIPSSLTYGIGEQDLSKYHLSHDSQLHDGQEQSDKYQCSSGAVAASWPPPYYTGNFAAVPFRHQRNSTYTASPTSPDCVLLCELGSDHAEYDCAPTLSPQFLRSHLEYQPLIPESDQSIEANLCPITGSYNLQPQNINSNVSTEIGGGEPLEKIACFYDDCTKTFSRVPDLDRHLLNVHNRVGHHCQVLNCSNNKGKGYCRPDKLKEHMWKKHGLVANLSYTKAVPSSV